MKTVAGRIAKLENRFGDGDATRRSHLCVVCNEGWGLALDVDRCVDILRECGYLPTGPGFGLVDLGGIPDDLNAEELERYLRENGAAMR